MSSSLVWMGLAGGEFMLIIFLALLVSWLRHRTMRRRDRKAVQELVSYCRGRKDERLAEISEFLGEKYAMEGDVQGYAARSLYKAEASLIQSFARTYLNRDAKAASRFHKPVQEGVGEYWALDPGLTGEEAVESAAEELAAEAADQQASAEAAEDDGAELERLRKENQSLSDELRLTMDTMGRMLNEYSSVFSKDADLGDIQVIGAESDPDGEAAMDAAAEPEPVPESESDEVALEPTAEAAQAEEAAVLEEEAPQMQVEEPAPAAEPAAEAAATDTEAAADTVSDVDTALEPGPEAAAEAEEAVEVSGEAAAPVEDIDALLQEVGATADAEEAGGEDSDEDIDELIKQLDKEP